MRWVLYAAVVGVFGAGCKPTCVSTCNRYYAEEECDARPDGIPADEAIPSCITACEAAIDVPGPAPAATDPRFLGTAPSPTAGELANEQEAAAWMDCVWSFATLEECREDLDRQFCMQVYLERG